jgi:hypothetical protein
MTPCGLLGMSNTNVFEAPVASIFSVKEFTSALIETLNSSETMDKIVRRNISEQRNHRTKLPPPTINLCKRCELL